MKQIAIVAGIVLTASTVFGQGKDLTSAGMAFNSSKQMMMEAQMTGDFSKVQGKILKAKEYIDASYAKQQESGTLKSKDIPKLYAYRSQIYMYYTMVAAQDEELKSEIENNAEMYEEIIFGDAKKCRELDKKGMYFPEIEAQLNMIRITSANEGVNMFNEKKFEEAYEMFATAAKIADVVGVVDTLSNYNAGLAAENLEKYDEAAEYYKYCAEKGYGKSSSYVNLSQAYRKAEKNEESQKAVSEGLEKYPGDMDLIKEQLNGFLIAGEFDKAEANLAKVIEKEPNNAALRFSIGTIYDNLKQYDKAEAAYNDALAIDPEYFDALYSKGASYVNQAVEKFDKIETLTDLVVKESEAKAADELIKKALPVLEKAHSVNPEDDNTKIALKGVYARLDLEEKYNEMKEKLKN